MAILNIFFRGSERCYYMPHVLQLPASKSFRFFLESPGGGWGGVTPPEYIAQTTAEAVGTELQRHGATCREVGTPREDVLLVTRIDKTV